MSLDGPLKSGHCAETVALIFGVTIGPKDRIETYLCYMSDTLSRKDNDL